ncbi:MAG: thioredoxin fold domain-containing protein [Burkholderiaceae bacterium]|jgi:thiol:disulfide interchange protein DsbG|nr:thioredoxin fold domain-containing protein [Burkholderiaceae bacterium]MDZ4144792.1 thioredoxin fold domain-containing protein [Burkholderiales bacterium]PKO44765.1 MAG: thiol:disulfide interchange protein [Betaproteobacteria bacterium HGW-Betaproteobacteria-3]
MFIRLIALPVLAAALLLSACSKEGPPAQPAAATPIAQPYEAVAAQGKGFTVGAMMSANTVYVLFDPQCPHCGRLWEASLPLQAKVKFVWMPVAFINAKSAPQGAALMTATNPQELMTTHEKSILSGAGGISAPSGIPAEITQAIEANTRLLNSLGADSVPYIVAKNLRTGEVVSNTGALETPALADFLGVDRP